MKCQKCGEEINDFVLKDKEEALSIVINLCMGFDINREDLEDFI